MTAARPLLLVEDEWMLASMMATMLRADGQTVLGPVKSVAEALEAIARQQPAFALLDVTLGREHSFPVADELLRRGVPFLLMTGYTADDLPPAYRRHTILQKPISRDRLLAAVRAGLGLSGP